MMLSTMAIVAYNKSSEIHNGYYINVYDKTFLFGGNYMHKLELSDSQTVHDWYTCRRRP